MFSAQISDLPHVSQTCSILWRSSKFCGEILFCTVSVVSWRLGHSKSIKKIWCGLKNKSLSHPIWDKNFADERFRNLSIMSDWLGLWLKLALIMDLFCRYSRQLWLWLMPYFATRSWNDFKLFTWMMCSNVSLHSLFHDEKLKCFYCYYYFEGC